MNYNPVKTFRCPPDVSAALAQVKGSRSAVIVRALRESLGITSALGRRKRGTIKNAVQVSEAKHGAFADAN